MCPAIHTKSRSWLRSSSTREPSDPLLRVVQFIFGSGFLPLLCVRNLLGCALPRDLGGKARGCPFLRKTLARSPPVPEAGLLRAARESHREWRIDGAGASSRRSSSSLARSEPHPLSPSRRGTGTPWLSFRQFEVPRPVWREGQDSIAAQTGRGVRVPDSQGVSRVRETDGNDPSAGSPTETLLRLLLPLNDQVWSSFRHTGATRRPLRAPVRRPH